MPYRAYKYGYCILYQWWIAKHGKNESPIFNSLLGYSLLLFLNVVSVLSIIQAVTGINIAAIVARLPKFGVIMLALTVWVVNYFALAHEGKYKATIKEFEPKNLQEQRKMIIEAWFYIIGSLAVLFISWMLIYLRKNYGF